MTGIFRDFTPGDFTFLAIVVAILIGFVVSKVADIFTREDDRPSTPAELAAEQIEEIVRGVRMNDMTPAEGERLILAVRDALGATEEKPAVAE